MRSRNSFGIALLVAIVIMIVLYYWYANNGGYTPAPAPSPSPTPGPGPDPTPGPGPTPGPQGKCPGNLVLNTRTMTCDDPSTKNRVCSLGVSQTLPTCANQINFAQCPSGMAYNSNTNKCSNGAGVECFLRPGSGPGVYCYGSTTQQCPDNTMIPYGGPGQSACGVFSTGNKFGDCALRGSPWLTGCPAPVPNPIPPCPPGMHSYGDGSACSGGGRPDCGLWGNRNMPSCYCQAGTKPYGDGSACASAGVPNCALWGNPELPRCQCPAPTVCPAGMVPYGDGSACMPSSKPIQAACSLDGQPGMPSCYMVRYYPG